MEFRLPSNLQSELLAYDPALKALARQNKPGSTKAKSKYPLGAPTGLIPVHIVNAKAFDDAVTYINSQAAKGRFKAFKRLQQTSNGENKNVTYALLYHYEQCWYAAWLPNEGNKNDYLYGYSVAYKDTATAWKTLPYNVKQSKDDYTQVTYGRSVFYTYSQCVTKDDIRRGNDGRNWRNWNLASVPGYHEKTRELHPEIRLFEDALRDSIPTWTDSNNMFQRIQAKSMADILFSTYDCSKEYWNTTDKDTWVPSYTEIVKLITFHLQSTDYSIGPYKEANKILHIISKPFFKAWIQARCEESIAAFKNESTKDQRTIKCSWKLIHALFDRIYYVNKIWPDCPIDYYQTHLNTLLGLHITGTVRSTTATWLNAHMPVASYFKIIDKYYQEKNETDRSRSYCYSADLNINVYYLHEWTDTLSMLTNVLENLEDAPGERKVLAPPKRWRITEFHDYVQAEAWKIKNKNESLPQDLFPTPIKVTLGSSSWSFFQPIDTHQLAQWGQAVRNCVGNATHYAEDVRKKKHFIVLAMVDNKPQFTIQLEVNMGLMSVKQIAGVGNASLSLETKELYKTSFAKALQLRDQQLQS